MAETTESFLESKGSPGSIETDAVGEGQPYAGGWRSTAARRWAIVQELQRVQKASIAELSDLLGASRVSIRRDLEHLERTGVLKRVHGGAEYLTQPGQSIAFDARMLHNLAIKQAIGRAAAQLIRPRETLMVDPGTTALQVVRSIPPALLQSGGLTIVTRSIMIAFELRTQRQIRLIVLGGLYVPDNDDLVGPLTEGALSEVKVNTLFMGTDGASAARGLTTDNVREASLVRRLAHSADRVIVVTDSSKIGVDKIQAILSLEEINVFVTDEGAPPDFTKLLQDRGVQVILVPRA